MDALGRPRPGPAAGRHRGAVGPARPLRRPVPSRHVENRAMLRTRCLSLHCPSGSTGCYLLGSALRRLAIGAGGTLWSCVAPPPGCRPWDVPGPHRTAVAARGGGTGRAGGVPARARSSTSPCWTCRTGGCPPAWERAKLALEELRTRGEPDLILAPSPHDAHQDHRTFAKLVPTAFRDHLILGYEILKWDGDLAQPTVFLPAGRAGAPREDRQAARALRLPARPQLVRPGGVRRPRPGSRGSVPRPLRRGLPRRETGPWARRR